MTTTRDSRQGAVLDKLRSAYANAAAWVESAPDPVAAFERANELRGAVEGMVGETATLRARAADRVRVAEGLSLGQLAERLGLSKTRADQFVRLAREAGEG